MPDKEKKVKKNWFVRHKTLTVLIAIFLVGFIAIAVGGDSSTTTKNGISPSATNENSNTSNEVVAKIGEPARDGKFEFIVKGLDCGKTTVGTNEYLTKTAQGQFCMLSITIKNIGNEPQSLFSANHYLFNATGQKYAADDTATMYAAPQGATWYSDINPGNSVEGIIVFDIPKDQIATSAQLHDSAYSNGVKISLQ